MRFEELEVGTALPTLVKPPIERIQLVKYAGASGDFNRIHVEEGFATSAGYKSVFAHGMLSMAFLGQLVTDWVGPAAIRRLGVRFKAITWPGDVITCTGEVSALDPATRTATVKLMAQNQLGETTCEGSAEVRF
jgi:acyl dehydratase